MLICQILYVVSNASFYNSSYWYHAQDTAQDVYETEDVFPTRPGRSDSSEDESSVPARGVTNGSRSKVLDPGDGVDSSGLISTEEASKKFKKAERRRAYSCIPGSIISI